MDALRPLSLDQFAAMTAEMEAGFPRDRVLESASVSPEQWELTQETWLLRMAKQGAQRKLALLDRYNELLAKHRKAAQRKMRAEKRKLKGPMPVPAEAHLSPLARARPEDAASGATFQKATPRSDASAPSHLTPSAPNAAGGDGAGRAPAWIASPAAPPMVAGASSAAVPIVTPPPAAVELSPPMDTLDDDDMYDEGTTAVGAVPEALVASAGPAWLSGPRPAQPPPSPASHATPPPAAPPPAAAPSAGPAWLTAKAPPPREESTTVQPSPKAPASAGPAWLQSSSSLPAVPFQPPAAPAQAQRDPPPRPSTSDALPFQRPDTQPRRDAAPRPPTSGGLPFQRPDTHKPSPSQAASPAAPAPRPSTPPPAAPRARLSIEQLAWLQAQMDASPELGRAAREQLGMSEADYAGERAVWQARFQQDRPLVERYSQLFYHYRRPRQ